MSEFSITKRAVVPDGPVCVNWSYRTTMSEAENFRCEHYRRDSAYYSDRDMGGAGSGGSYMYSSRCALFDTYLSDEIGVGPTKCAECLKACGESKEIA